MGLRYDDEFAFGVYMWFVDFVCCLLLFVCVCVLLRESGWSPGRSASQPSISRQSVRRGAGGR